MEPNGRKSLTPAVLKGQRLEGRGQGASDPWRYGWSARKGSRYPDSLFTKNTTIVFPPPGPFPFLCGRAVQNNKQKTYLLFTQKPKGDEQGCSSGLIAKIQTDQKPNAI